MSGTFGVAGALLAPQERSEATTRTAMPALVSEIFANTQEAEAHPLSFDSMLASEDGPFSLRKPLRKVDLDNGLANGEQAGRQKAEAPAAVPGLTFEVQVHFAASYGFGGDNYAALQAAGSSSPLSAVGNVALNGRERSHSSGTGGHSSTKPEAASHRSGTQATFPPARPKPIGQPSARAVHGSLRNNGGPSSAGPSGAIRPGFDANILDRNDDDSTDLVSIGFSVNFFCNSYSGLYVNNNGNVTFGSPLSTYTPPPLSSLGQEIIAPFFADVDTRNPASGVVTYGQGMADGQPAFGVNWIDVGYYNQHADPTNSFQLVLISRPDVGPGNFDIEFNYQRILWETGDASGGVGGLGGDSARAGYSTRRDVGGSAYELPGSAINGAYLDSGPNALVSHSENSDVLGRYVYAIRGQADCVALDIDSDNDNGFDPPNSGPAERATRDDPTLPGKLVMANLNDKNDNGIPDFADGYDLQGDPVVNPQEQFTPLVLQLSGPVDLNQAQIRFTYNASDPAAVSVVNDVYTPAPGDLRIWTHDGNTARHEAPANAPIPGDYVAPGVYTTAQLGLSSATPQVVLYVEGITASTAQGVERIVAEVDPDGQAGFNFFDAVRATIVGINVERKAGAGWEDAGDYVPLYRPNPVIRLPDLTDGQITGNTFAIPAAQSQAFDPITFVSQVDYSINGGGWQNLATVNQPAPATPGDAYEGRFQATLGGMAGEGGGLNALRMSALGTRRRYVFRATDYVGRTAYEELNLEVQLDPTDGSHKLHAVSPLGHASPPSVPDTQKLRFHIQPVLVAANTVVLNLPAAPIRLNVGGTAQTTFTMTVAQVQNTEFVLLDDTKQSGPPLPEHTYPHFLRNFSGVDTHKVVAEYRPLPALLPAVKFTKEVRGAAFTLTPFGADDSTKFTDPSTVRYNPTPVTADDFERNKFLMLPLKLTGVPAGAFGQVSLTNALIGNPEVQLFKDGQNIPSYTASARSFATQPTVRFLLNGSTRDGFAVYKVTYNYRNRDIFEDKVSVQVSDLPGVAGEPLADDPYFAYVHTFNQLNPGSAVNPGNPVYAALDPFIWRQLTKNKILPANAADKLTARISIVNHRSPSLWAADNRFIEVAGATFPLEGTSLQANVRQLFAGAGIAPGDYDVIYGLADRNGDPGPCPAPPNCTLDPGDIVGVWTGSGANHALDAEVHVVDDAGVHTEYASSSSVDFNEPYFDTSNGNNRVYVRLRGRLQYPDNGGALAATTPRVRAVRNRNPVGTINNVVVGGGAVAEFWTAVFDGTRWYLRGSVSGGQGDFGVAVAGPPRVWNIVAANGRIQFRITDGAAPNAFAPGDEVSLNVARQPRTDGPYPLVVVAHGNHSAFTVTQPKYASVTNLVSAGVPFMSLRNEPGANGVNDQRMTVLNPTVPTGFECYFIRWDPDAVGVGMGRWRVYVSRPNCPSLDAGKRAELTPVPDGAGGQAMTPSDVNFTIPVFAGQGGRFTFRIEAAAEAANRGFYVEMTPPAETPDENYRGYSYLLSHLAQNGFAVLSLSLDDMNNVDRDFAWSRPVRGAGGAVLIPSAGGTLSGIEERARVINEVVQRWRDNTGNLRTDLGLDNRIDFTQITLLGHSRGGEAVARAPLLGGPVYSQVVSIAPTDNLARGLPGGPDPVAPISTTVSLPFLALYGSHDGDVREGSAFRLYDRASPAAATGSKQLVFLRQANHNYFNESWPRNDLTGNDAPNMFNGAANPAASQTQHRLVAKSYITAFLNGNVARNNINGNNIPKRPYYAEYFQRASAHLRPASVRDDVAFNQYLGAPNARTIVQDFEAAGAPDRVVHQLPLTAGQPEVGGYTQWTAVGDVNWVTSTPAVFRSYPVPAVARDFTQRQAVTVRIAQELERPAPFHASGNTTPLSVTLQIVAGGQQIYVRTGLLSLVNLPIDRGAAGGANTWNKLNFVTIRIPTTILRNNGRNLNLTNVQSIGLIFDQRVTGWIGIDDIGADS